MSSSRRDSRMRRSNASLRQLDAPHCIAHRAFPAEVSSHPGWLEPGAVASQRVALEAEAAATAVRSRNLPVGCSSSRKGEASEQT